METNNPGQVAFDQIMQIYTNLGYPTKLISQWSTPEQDVQCLCDKIKELQPKKILEIGSFVGTTALAMAAAATKNCAIYALDPNLPIQDELTSLGTNLFGLDCTAKTLDLAAKAAQGAGLATKMNFLAGGFSTGLTYTALNADINATVPVVGPDICQRFGPFDFIFIDGLHYTDAVLSDLELAAQHLTPGGIIALHDSSNRCWGPHVRRAIFQFLENRDEFRLLDTDDNNLAADLSFIRYAAPGSALSTTAKTLSHETQESMDQQIKAVPYFARFLYQHYKPKSIVDIGCGDGLWLRTFLDLGVKEIAGVDQSQEEIIKRNRSLSDLVSVCDLRQPVKLPKRYDLCLCLDILNKLEPEYEDNLVKSLVNASDTIIFSVPALGHHGRGDCNDRPVTHWVEKFWRHGYVVHDNIRPMFEGMKHIPETNFQLNTFSVRKTFDANLLNEQYANIAFAKELVLERERRIEDLFLQIRSVNQAPAPAKSDKISSCLSDNDQSQLEAELHMVDFEIPGSAIEHCGGALYSYIFKTHAAQLYARLPKNRDATLFENGNALNTATQSHDEIRSMGMGRYAMQQRGVYFSASDNSDPRTNGRKYTFKCPAYLKFIEAIPQVTINNFKF